MRKKKPNRSRGAPMIAHAYRGQEISFPNPTARVVPTREGYSRWAEVYDGDDNALVLLEEDQIEKVLGPVKGQAIADIGCGTGRHALRLAVAGAKVTAVDFSEGMLAKARAKAGANAIRFVRHDVTRKLPLPSGRFDRVLSCLVVDHVPRLTPFFAELGRLARRDGFVVVSVMHPAMMLRGVQARFIDPATGTRISPRSYPHQLSDYVMAAVRAGLKLDHLSEHIVDEALAARSPRGSRYLGWPLLLLMKLRRD